MTIPHARPDPYAGPERRGGVRAHRLLSLMLDEVDYGLLLLSADRQVLHVNQAARQALRGEHPLVLQAGELRSRSPRDAAPLLDALRLAAERGLRHLLSLGEGSRRVHLSVVPLGVAGADAGILVVLGRRQVSGALAVQCFARTHRLSTVEEQVLHALCDGQAPSQIAMDHGVKIATVRTQIASIRGKTGTSTIRDLVQMVARLPPLVGVLRLAVEPADAPELAWAA